MSYDTLPINPAVGDVFPLHGTGSGMYLCHTAGAWTKVAELSAGASPAWGAITGTLVDQTDLQSALDGKVGTGDSRLTDARQLAAGTDKTKLDGIATGAEVNVNADWNSGSGDSQILNKPAVQPIGYAALANDTLAQALATNIVTKLTVTAARTLTTTVPAAGVRCAVMILTSGTATYTITFGSGFKPTGTLATGTTNARIFVVNFISDGINLYEAGRTAAMAA